VLTAWNAFAEAIFRRADLLKQVAALGRLAKEGTLLRGTSLRRYESLRRESLLTESVKEFMNRSLEAEREEIATQARETAERRRARLRLAMVLGGGLVLSAVFALFIWWRSDRREVRLSMGSFVSTGDGAHMLRGLDALSGGPLPSEWRRAWRTNFREDASSLWLLLSTRADREKHPVASLILEGAAALAVDSGDARVAMRAIAAVVDAVDNVGTLGAAAAALDFLAGSQPELQREIHQPRDRVARRLQSLAGLPPPELPVHGRQAIAASAYLPGWVALDGGTFSMGCDHNAVLPDGCRPVDTPQHEVSVSAFQVLNHEVTVGEFRALYPNDFPTRPTRWRQPWS
jgi:hypothetical protein